MHVCSMKITWHKKQITPSIISIQHWHGHTHTRTHTYIYTLYFRLFGVDSRPSHVLPRHGSIIADFGDFGWVGRFSLDSAGEDLHGSGRSHGSPTPGGSAQQKGLSKKLLIIVGAHIMNLNLTWFVEGVAFAGTPLGFREGVPIYLAQLGIPHVVGG